MVGVERNLVYVRCRPPVVNILFAATLLCPQVRGVHGIGEFGRPAGFIIDALRERVVRLERQPLPKPPVDRNLQSIISRKVGGLVTSKAPKLGIREPEKRIARGGR